jgi:hypothetical protein
MASPKFRTDAGRQRVAGPPGLLVGPWWLVHDPKPAATVQVGQLPPAGRVNAYIHFTRRVQGS